MSHTLDTWMAGQYRHAAAAMLRGISPGDIVKTRPGFGQTIVPVRGAIVASPILAAYDPDPDYFFHWYRDSAIVIDALRLLHEDGTLGAEAVGHVGDFVRFSLALRECDGRPLAADAGWRAGVAPDFVQFLRTGEDLARAHGDAIAGETRVNPDGTLDISGWPRPQHDGIALRALALMRWIASGATFDAATQEAIATLLQSDLSFTHRRWREPGYDIWEEEKGWPYYTLCVQAAALDSGGAWFAERGDQAASQACRAEAAAITDRLDGYWLPEAGCYRSRVLEGGARTAKSLDISVILAAIHAGGAGDRHSIRDPRMHATLDRLEALFHGAYAINADRPPGQGPAMGRYEGDVYYTGGAYYFATLGAAEFCFRAAEAGYGDASLLIRRGDAFVETVRAFTPADGALSEQFDRTTGQQSSAKDLGWSYAAFIGCIAGRRDALAEAG